MDELDSRQRIRTATIELARLILLKDDIASPVVDRVLRLLRPARGRSGDYIGPVKSKIKKKLISQTGGAKLASDFEKSFDALKSISAHSSPLGVNLLYSFMQTVEPLCFSLTKAHDNFFNSTLLCPVDVDLLHNTPSVNKLRNSGVHATDRQNLDVELLQSGANQSQMGNGNSLPNAAAVGIWVERDMEIILMRDLLYVFQGIAGKYIKYERKTETYMIDPALGLRQSVKDVVFSLCEIGWLYAKIETFLSRLMQGSSGANMGGTNDLFRGLVAQAFAYSIQEELHDYYRLLAVLELELTKTSAGDRSSTAPAVPTFGKQTNPSNKQNDVVPSHHWLIPAVKTDSVSMHSAASDGVEYSGLTLLRLNTWMQQPFERLYCIARLVEAISALSGGALLSRLHNYTRHGDARMASFSQSIMQSVCAPVYHMIARWILYGELQDPYNEFFIGYSGVGKEQHNWNDVYFIRQSMLPTFIPLSLAKQIFLIGKSINFLRHCKLKLSSSHGGQQQSHFSGQRSQPRGHALVTPTKQQSRGGTAAGSPGTPGSAVKKIEFSFGRKFTDAQGMVRPSVANALGYSPSQTSLANSNANVRRNGNSRRELAERAFVPTDPNLESEETAVRDTLRYTTKNNSKYYDDEEEDDEFDLGEIVEDEEEEEDFDDLQGDFVDLNAKSLLARKRARALSRDRDGVSDTESIYSETAVSDDEDGAGDASVAAAWLLRDKELENAIKNLQYSGSTMYDGDSSGKQNSTTEFEEWIVRISSTVDRKLLHMLEAKFHLTAHLAALKNFILLGQGDFVLCLMDNMGQELKKRANQLYRHNLTGLLEGALRSSNAQYEPSFILDRIGIRLLEAQPGDTGWEVFSLDYAVDFPLSAIVHADALTKYHAMFHMLWRLKRVEWVLADSYEQLMEFKRRQGLLILPKLLPVIHKCTMRRASMMHVVNNLSGFLMFEVLETSWLKLQDGIQNCANNLDDIISLHDSYLDEILTKSMLTPAYEMLNMQIQQVVQTVLRFCGLEEALLFDANTSMQRKRSQKIDMESSSISTGTWGVIDESVLSNPAGTVEGVPSYVITRMDDAYDDFIEQLTTLMTMLNEQGGEIGEILRFLNFRLDYNNYMSNLKTSHVVPGTGTGTGSIDPQLSQTRGTTGSSHLGSSFSMNTPVNSNSIQNLGVKLNVATINRQQKI